MEKLGVFFSANDRVYDWTIAFLESFRAFNSSMPLRLIPFNEESDRTKSLAAKYDFVLFEHESFPRLEAIGRKLEIGHTLSGPFWFRRFASFWGDFDCFLYLDCRTLVLNDLKTLISPLEESDFDLLHYDTSVDQVYEPGLLRRELLRDARTRGFNSGRWAARRDLFTLCELESLGLECVDLRKQMNPRNTDQFFLNYCCDRKCAKTAHFAEVIGDMCQDGWARQPGYVYRDNDGYRRWDHGGLNHRKRVPLLHWAGINLSPAMPEAELFYKFRDAKVPIGRRVSRRLRRSLLRPCLKLSSLFRRNRFVNRTWHRFRG